LRDTAGLDDLEAAGALCAGEPGRQGDVRLLLVLERDLDGDPGRGEDVGISRPSSPVR